MTSERGHFLPTFLGKPMASPAPPDNPGILIGRGTVRRSSFTSAELFPGDDSDDDESLISAQDGVELSLNASLASSSSSKCSRPTPAAASAFLACARYASGVGAADGNARTVSR